MKTLKNCIKLSSSVKIYVPSTVNVDQHCDTSDWVNRCLKLLSQEFGGSTASTALGAWVNNSGDLIKENVVLVFAFAKQAQLESSMETIYNFCLDMKKNLGQEAIALEVNGELYLI